MMMMEMKGDEEQNRLRGWDVQNVKIVTGREEEEGGGGGGGAAALRCNKLRQCGSQR